MPVDEAFRQLMPDEVLIAPATGKNASGERTYGADVAYKCRISGKIRIVRDTVGAERVSSVKITLDRYVGLDANARVTLPARYNPRKPPIISIAQVTDELGPHHEAIYC